METFTRDRDGAQFEFKELSRDDEGAFQGFLIQKNPEPKTIDWDVVIELGLLCEFWDRTDNGNVIGRLEYVSMSADYPFRNKGSCFWKHCRILPDQVVSYDSPSDFMRRITKVGLDFRWDYGSPSRKKILTDIKPAEGYTYEVQK